MGKLISVITLSYNNLHYFDTCLQSIIDQDYEQVEWILCDDGSEDFEQWVTKIYYFLDCKEHHLKRICIKHHDRNQGVIQNYWQGIKEAQGEYIFYLAIDDMFYDSGVLRDIEAYFEETGVKILTGLREMFFDDGKSVIQPYPYEVDLLKSGNMKEIFQKDIRTPMYVGACTPFAKSLIDEYGFVEDGYKHLEDWPRYLHLMEQGIIFGFLDRRLIKYRAGGITYEITNPDLIQDFKKLFSKYMNPPYSQVFNAMQTKTYVIAWGASGGFLKYYQAWVNMTQRSIDFIVDKNQEQWGKTLEDIPIYSPRKILELPQEQIYVLIFSQRYYVEIAKELEEMGLIEGMQFDVVSEVRVVGYE